VIDQGFLDSSNNVVSFINQTFTGCSYNCNDAKPICYGLMQLNSILKIK